jgi:predicted Rossmann-fold nucleotide-binding protein
MNGQVSGLIETYQKAGWGICDPSLGFTCRHGNTHERGLIVRISKESDLSTPQLRELLGITDNQKIVSFHSGVCGDSQLKEIISETARSLRLKGFVICNGGYPALDGGMRSVITGAKSANDGEKELPPIIIVVTEDLFLKDHRKGDMYPENVRILILEDSAHKPNTMLRAHMLNNLGEYVLSFVGGVGTYTEGCHLVEQKGLNPESHPQKVTFVNLGNFYRGLAQQFVTAVKQKYMPIIPNVNFYTDLFRRTSHQIAGDLVRIVESNGNATISPEHGGSD